MSDLENKEILDFITKGLDNESVYLSKDGRIARKVMIELVKAGYADFLLLRDDEVREWWDKVYSGVRAKFERYQEKVRNYELKLSAYEKLTPEQRKVLGVRKPIKPKGLE